MHGHASTHMCDLERNNNTKIAFIWSEDDATIYQDQEA